MTFRILIVDDDTHLLSLLERQLVALGYDICCAGGAAEALRVLREDRAIDLVVTDLRMPGTEGDALCGQIIAERPGLPVVLMTAFGSMEAATRAIRAGAYDFLAKPFEPEALELVIERALQHRSMREELRRLRRLSGEVPGYRGMVGTSEIMQRVFDLVDRIASSPAPVFVSGETGTGKELIARALHDARLKSDGKFWAIKCAALPPGGIEEAMSLAISESGKGFAGGTLFLDRIEDLSTEAQGRLLRILQDQLGRGPGGVESSLRFISSTDTTSDVLLDGLRFRPDLFYRLAVIEVQVPPLRARGDDVALLAEHFLGALCARASRPALELSGEATDALQAHSWPGNVRELENAMARAVAVASGSTVDVLDLPEGLRGAARAPTSRSQAQGVSEFASLFDVERRHILRVVDAVGGNKSKAARVLGIDRKTLHAKLARYGR